MNFHGGDIYNYNGHILDFSSNINPLGVPDSFRHALLENLEAFTQYPDIQYRSIKERIGIYLNKRPDCVLPGNGAVDLIYRLIGAAACERVYGVCPGFSEYRRAAETTGKQFIEIPAYDAEYRSLDIEMLLKAVTPDSLVVLCNPNNPTGTLLPKHDMCMLAERLADKNCLLMIDEAFMEFVANYPEDSMVGYTEAYDNLFIIKAATKFFGMPGIRLGYLISGNREMLEKIGDKAEPWSINTAAVIAAGCIYHDGSYIEKSRLWVNTERPFLFEQLNRIDGIKAYYSDANYHLVELTSRCMDVWQLKKAMSEMGVLIRTPEGFNGLTPYHFRLAVKDRAANLIMLDALKAVIEDRKIKDAE